jgi:CHASE1-domain containing sensor protein
MDRRNRAAIGYDMFTDPTRRATMERARDSGQPAASGIVTLVQELDADKQPGFLIYVPVYDGPTPRRIDRRRARLRGFVYSPFRAGDLFAGILGSNQRPRAGFATSR